MSKPVIKIENLSKLYRLGEISTGMLTNDINRWWQMNIRGKEDPYAKIGKVNDRTQNAVDGEYVYALKDINLEVHAGEVLGVIGKNGAGKSSLLKILSRVTAPTTGSVKLKGRLASLLEVGTGFHPEMTGRENIYMNGTIMGMRKWEIDNKLEEIVEFSGVAKYLDTPTKRYSSGMTVRLGFAVAAYLESEILVVDEVLAVGDAEFQKRAIGKMQEVSQGQGRTVLFVSHNMESIKRLCTSVSIFDNGQLSMMGPTLEGINQYLQKFHIEKNSWHKKDELNSEIGSSSEIDIHSVHIISNEVDEILTNLSIIEVEIKYSIKIKDDRFRFVFSLLNSEEIELFSASDFYLNTPKEVGNYSIAIKLPVFLLNKGKYIVRIRVDIPQTRVVVKSHDYVGFNIYHIVKDQIGVMTSLEPKGLIHIPVEWEMR